MNETFFCPLCKAPMRVQRGSEIDSVDGYSVDCVNPGCGMDSGAHGKDSKAAYEIFKQKCGITGREKNSDTGNE